MTNGNTVAKNTIFLTIGSIAQKLLSFVYFTTLARFFLPAEDIGKYLYAISFATLFSVIVDFGLQPVIIREIAEDATRARIIVGNVLGIKLILGAVTAIAILTATRAVESDIVRIQLVSFAALFILLDSVHLTFYAVLRGLQRLRYEAVGGIVGQGIIMTTGITLLLFKQPLPYLMFAFVAGSVWNVIFSSLIIKRIAGVSFTLRWDSALIRTLIRFALPFAIAGIFVRVYSAADTVLLGRFLSDTDVALYGVPYKFVYAFQFIPIALSAALFPAFARTVINNRARAGELFAQSKRYLMLFVFPLIAGMLVLAKPIITIFYGAQYLPAAPVMQLLAIGLLPAFFDFPVGALLNASHRQNVQTTLMGVVMTVNVVMNLVLIPIIGALGAASAALVGNSILWIGGLMWVPHIVSVPWKSLLLSFMRIGGATALMGILVALTAPALSLPASIALGALSYLGALFLLREVGRRDVTRLRDLIRPTT